MRPKIQYEQLPRAFMTEGWGETPDAVHEGTESPTAERGPEDPATVESLREEVCERENLERAWHQVRSNQGSPGVDGRTIDETRDYLREHWPTIREQLLNGTYRPQPVRRVEIAKPDGGVRKLGIPTVLDRLIQQAILQVLQGRWDPTVSEHSSGFRPGRSAHPAVAQAQSYGAEGGEFGVDIDLEKFFDRVHHDIVRDRVARRISDKRLRRLIRAYLNAGVREDGLVGPTDEGVPQGGPLSPLLSNLVLDEFDRELTRRGRRFCRDADDCNIDVGSRRAGERVLKSVGRFLTTRLQLKVNESKSAVARSGERKFLGFTISNDSEPLRQIAAKALQKFKARIRELTCRMLGVSLPQLIAPLAR
jgi:RNA-directed DNA polymerase